MGRKGVNKRKSSQKKGIQSSRVNVSSGNYSLRRATGTIAVRLPEQDKTTMPAGRSTVNLSLDSRINSRKR